MYRVVEQHTVKTWQRLKEASINSKEVEEVSIEATKETIHTIPNFYCNQGE